MCHRVPGGASLVSAIASGSMLATVGYGNASTGPGHVLKAATDNQLSRTLHRFCPNIQYIFVFISPSLWCVGALESAESREELASGPPQSLCLSCHGIPFSPLHCGCLRLACLLAFRLITRRFRTQLNTEIALNACFVPSEPLLVLPAHSSPPPSLRLRRTLLFLVGRNILYVVSYLLPAQNLFCSYVFYF